MLATKADLEAGPCCSVVEHQPPTRDVLSQSPVRGVQEEDNRFLSSLMFLSPFSFPL